MTAPTVLFRALPLLALAACAAPEPEPATAPFDGAPAWASFRAERAPGPWDDVTILAVATREGLGGPEAVVDVTWTSACEGSTFAVFWNGVAARSLPPQTVFELRRDGQGADCAGAPGSAKVAFSIEQPAEDLGPFIGRVHDGQGGGAEFRWTPGS